MLMHRGWSHYIDQLRDDLWQNHPQIHIEDFEFYSMDVFNRCENTSNVLLAIPGWDHSIPFGILHAKHPTPVVQRFLDAAKEVSGELYGHG